MAPVKLISLDVGGTLGFLRGQSIATMLSKASKLPHEDKVKILRNTLLVAPRIDKSLIDALCKSLELQPISFPRTYSGPTLQLFPWALSTLQTLRRFAPLVTLSNACCLDSDLDVLKKNLGNHLRAYYVSCQIGYAKPDPRAFETVASKEHVAVESILHIGDSWECDALGALGAGAQAVWVSHGRPIPTKVAFPASQRLRVTRNIVGVKKYLSLRAKSK
ncbi:MAG: HAD family hydrolase [Thaumarchaeota archaeon]|nr:HAD family hydrolase [Nitrososphaerota archaeon]